MESTNITPYSPKDIQSLALPHAEDITLGDAASGTSLLEDSPKSPQGPTTIVADNPPVAVVDNNNTEEFVSKLINVLEGHLMHKARDDVSNAVKELSRKIDENMSAPWYESTVPLGIGVGLLDSYYRHYLLVSQSEGKRDIGRVGCHSNPNQFLGYSGGQSEREREISDAVSQVLGVSLHGTREKECSVSMARDKVKSLLSQLHWAFALNESLKKDLSRKLETTANINKQMPDAITCRVMPSDRQIQDRSNMEVAVNTLNDTGSGILAPINDGGVKGTMGEMTTNAMIDSLALLNGRSSTRLNKVLEEEAKKCVNAAINATAKGDYNAADRLKRRSLMLESLRFPLVTVMELEKDIGCVPSHFLQPVGGYLGERESNAYDYGKRVVELASEYAFLMGDEEDITQRKYPINPKEQRRRQQVVSDLLRYRWSRASLMSFNKTSGTTTSSLGSPARLNGESSTVVSTAIAQPHTIKELLTITLKLRSSALVSGDPFWALCPPSAGLLNAQFDTRLEDTGSLRFQSVKYTKTKFNTPSKHGGAPLYETKNTTSSIQQTILSAIGGVNFNSRPIPLHERTFTDCMPIVNPILIKGSEDISDTRARERRNLIQVARSGVGCHVLPCTGLQFTTYLPERHHHDWENVLLNERLGAGGIHDESDKSNNKGNKVKNGNSSGETKVDDTPEGAIDNDKNVSSAMRLYTASIAMSGPGGGIDYSKQPLYISDKGHFGGGGVFSNGILRREEKLGMLQRPGNEGCEQYGYMKTLSKDLKFFDSDHDGSNHYGEADRLDEVIYRSCARVNSLGIFIDRPTSFLAPNQQHHQDQCRELVDVDLQNRYHYPTMDLAKHRHDPIPMTSVRSIPFSSISEVILGLSPGFQHFCHRIRQMERAQRRLQIASKRQQHTERSFKYDSYSDASRLSEMDLAMSPYPLYPGYSSLHYREKRTSVSSCDSYTYTQTTSDDRNPRGKDHNSLNRSVHLPFPERFEIDDSGELLPRLDTVEGYYSRFYQCVTIVWMIPEYILGESYYKATNGQGEGRRDLLRSNEPEYFNVGDPDTLLYEAIPIVFDSRAEWNAFVTALSNTQYVTKRQIPIRFDSALTMDELLILRLGENSTHLMPNNIISKHPQEQALALMKTDEISLCREFHIPPLYYIAVKRRVLSPHCSPLKSYDDLLDVCDLDFFRLGAIMLFFIEYKGWVRSYTVYRPLRDVRATQLVGEK